MYSNHYIVTTEHEYSSDNLRKQKQGIVDVLVGEDYTRLKRCISILDFNLDEHPECHKVYRLRDER